MAGWISSKLKVAETLLQQIDQQAAESLGKNEKPPSPSAETATQIPQKLDSALPLKYQLPKRSPPVPPSPRADQTRQTPLPDAAKPSSAPSSSTHPDPAGIDWTELLSSPNRVSPAASPNGVRKKVKKPAIQAAVRPVESGKVEKEEDKPQGQSEKDEELQSFPIEKVELLGNSSESEGSSGSEPEGSDSGSDSEEERKRREERRKKREQMIAEKRAAAAVRAIKEREDSVARLEGEKESLEKMLEEKEKQQAQEVSELQTSMIKNMEAVELEKQKHNYTRMEALTRLAKLETTNAELARLLAITQRDLEAEVDRVSELRQKIEMKELNQKEHRERMLKIYQNSSSPSKDEPMRKAEVEQEILDAEYSFICNKITQLKDKAKKLEENIESTRREKVHPTEVEVELKKRLAQLTDHLIQKQTQVEALSSEKATMVLRIEMASRLLNENELSLQEVDVSYDSSTAAARFDIEAGAWQQPSNLRLRERIRSGRQHLGSLIQQLDAIFSAGFVFLRRNPMAQFLSLLYLLCLHIWVLYILL